MDTAFCLVGRLFSSSKLCFSTYFRQHMRGSDTKRYNLDCQYFETTLFCQVIALSELVRARSAHRLGQMCRYSRFALMQNKQRYPTSRTKLSTDKTVGNFENKDKFTVKKKYRKSIGYHHSCSMYKSKLHSACEEYRFIPKSFLCLSNRSKFMSISSNNIVRRCIFINC